MAEGPASVIPSAPEERWRISGAGPALFGVLPARTKMLRVPLCVVLTHVKDNSHRKRVTCDQDTDQGGPHGRYRQVHEILSFGLRSRRIRRNGKEAVRGSTRGTEGTPGHF